MVIFVLVLRQRDSYLEGFRIVIYFVPQAICSRILLLMVFLIRYELVRRVFSMFFVLRLSGKLGMAPLHGWFIQIRSKVGLIKFFLLNVVQKVLPLYLLMFFYSPFLDLLVALTVVISSIEALRRNNFILLLAFSSIFNLCWIVLSSHFSLKLIFLMAYGLVLRFLLFLSFRVFSISLEIMVWGGSLFIGGYFVRVIRLIGVPPAFSFLIKVLILKDLLWGGHGFLGLVLLMSSFVFLRLYIKFFMGFCLGPVTHCRNTKKPVFEYMLLPMILVLLRLVAV